MDYWWHYYENNAYGFHLVDRREEYVRGEKNWTPYSITYFTYHDLTDVGENSVNIPDKYSLFQNYPNPFNPETTIEFHLPQSGFTTLKVFDILGNEIITLVNEELSAGKYTRTISGTTLSSGIYFYRLSSGNFSETNKCILLK